MPAWPDAPFVREFLARASRRLAIGVLARGAVVAIGTAGVVLGLTWLAGWSPVQTRVASGLFGVAALLIAGRLAALRARAIAAAIERRAPGCRNIVITAAELVDHPETVRSYIGALVCRDASRILRELDVRTLFPVGRPIAAVTLAATLWVGAAMMLAARTAPSIVGSTTAAVARAGITQIDVTVTPPSYTGRPATTVRDPERLDVLEGSRLTVAVRTNAAAVRLETIEQQTAMSRVAPDTFAGDVLAHADGYLALQPAAGDTSAGPRRLIGLTVSPDRAPIVRVTKPGHDLFLSDAGRRIDLDVDAEDDLALAALSIAYTKVSGSGENFKFAKGELPLTLERRSGRAWLGHATLSLASLDLSPGDLIVYRGIAADARPGAPASESDAFIVEIVSAGETAAAGFAVDDQRDRYALSERMVILKTERLDARRASLAPDALAEEAANIAAEQRQVRAEFVFMMGGELADDVTAAADVAGPTELHEETEAMGEADLAAGRMANQGRLDLIRAIRAMSQATAALATPDTKAALVAENAALASLQRAFSKSRIILRALAEREALDLTRRLTGNLSGVGRDTRPPAEADLNPRVVRLRQALADLSTLAARGSLARERQNGATALAETILRIDPADQALQQIAQQLSRASTSAGSSLETTALLDQAAQRLAAAIRQELPDAVRDVRDLDTRRLSGAFADRLRRKERP